MSAQALRQAGYAIGEDWRLIDVYRRSFNTLLADTEELRSEAYRLRYQVYCVENAFEDPASKVGEEDTDEYDARAAHALLIHRQTHSVAGTVRLILPSPYSPQRSFPMQEICHDPLTLDPEAFPIRRVGEVSRFCVSKSFRRRTADTQFPSPIDVPSSADKRRLIPNITLGLIEGLVRMSAQHGVTYWCAIMDPTLLRLLSRLGIHFDAIGPLVEFHGRRQPCYKRLPDLLDRTRQERPDVWEVITNDGAHLDALNEIESQSMA